MCNQLNLVIKWRKLRNAVQCRFRQLQKKHIPATKECGFSQENTAIGFKPVCVLLKLTYCYFKFCYLRTVTVFEYSDKQFLSYDYFHLVSIVKPANFLA